MRIAARIAYVCLIAAPMCAAHAHTVHGKVSRAPAKPAEMLRDRAFPPAAITTLRLRAIERPINPAPTSDDKRLRVGVARDVAAERQEQSGPTSISWLRDSSGGYVGRVSVVSPRAASLRLGIRANGLPAEAELRFVSPSQPDAVFGPVRGMAVELASHSTGAYWTPVTDGEEQQVEVWMPPSADPQTIRLDIVSVSHISVSPRNALKSTGLGASQACEENVVCVAGSNPALDRASRSVAKLLYTDNGVTYLCTGTLIADENVNSQVPYIYTAAHCVGNSAAAATLNTFWFFQTASCNGKAAADYQQLTSGATLLYANAGTDAALLRLNEPAPAGAWFSGWDRSPVASSAALVALHHPAGDVKKVSLGQSVGITPSSASSGYYTATWLSGSTEGGSSGSGLFTFDGSEYVLRGGLRGGSAACSTSGHPDDPSNRDYYSRIDQEAVQLDKWLSAAPAPLLNYGGLWFDPDEPGWGLSIMQSRENHVFATWYGYDESGTPVWLVMPQASWNSSVAMEGSLYRTAGTPYDRPYDPSKFTVTPVGSLAVEFATDGSAVITLRVDGATSVKRIVRQPF